MKKMLAFLIVTCFLLVAAFVLVAAERKGGKLVIGKIPITLEHNYHQAHVKHLIAYAKDKYKADVNVIDGQFSADVALKAVEDFIAQGVNGILLHTTDEAVIDQAVNEAHKAKIPIVTFYIPSKSKLCPHVQINEAKTSFQMGQEAAKRWKEFYPNKQIYIGVIDFMNIEIVQIHRTQPFIKGVKDVDPTAEVASILEGSGTREKSMAAMQDMLQAHPEVNIIYGANADNALGALAALENAGRGKAVKGKPVSEIVIGTDATEGELLKLFNPSSSFKITQGLQPSVNAKTECDLLMKLINGEKAWDQWEVVDTFDKFMSYWSMKVEDGTKFLQQEYFSKVDLKSALKL
jgi:ABC-type sugar transport system substrate-binding protein